jgi:DNA-binding transcriptional MerR regulator
MDKSPDAFRTISEVAEVLDTPAHVLRFWESRFPQIKPVKRAGGRRYYRPADVALLTGIKRLLHDEGLTIRGVQKILRDHGVRHVAGLGDDSVSIDDLVAPTPDTSHEAEENAFLAIDEDEPEPPPPEPSPQPVDAPVRSRPAPQVPAEQSVLPLFESPPAFTRAEPLSPVPASPRKKPTQRDDATFASLIRALPSGSLQASRPEVARLAAQIARLRAVMAARANGESG